MSNSAGKPSRGGQTKAELRAETEAEIERRLDDTRKTLDRYIEIEVERRVWTWVKVVSAITVAVSFVLGLFGKEWITTYLDKGLKDATSTLVIDKIKAGLDDIQAQAKSKATEIDKTYAFVISNKTELVRISGDYFSDLRSQFNAWTISVSNYHSQVITNGEYFLDRLATLRAADDVIRIDDMTSLIIVQQITNQSEVLTNGFIQLDHEPILKTLQVRVAQFRTPDEIFRVRDIFPGKAIPLEEAVQGQKLDISKFSTLSNYLRRTSNCVVRIEYIKKPRFKTTP